MFNFEGSETVADTDADIIVPLDDAEEEHKVRDWTMAIGLRHYTKGQGCIPYVGSHVLGRNGVVHCDILMKRPCTEIWCGECVRSADRETDCAKCVPCMYRDGYIPLQSRMTAEQLRTAKNQVHHDRRRHHVVTYTAREDGVVCCVDMVFKFNEFYQVAISDEDAARVERFFRQQLWQSYNCTGIWLNYIAQLRFCCPFGTYRIDVDEDGADMSPRPWFCSEIVSTALMLCGADGFNKATRQAREPCAYTPDDIADIVKKNPRHFTEISQEDIILTLQHARLDNDSALAGDDEIAGQRRQIGHRMAHRLRGIEHGERTRVGSQRQQGLERWALAGRVGAGGHGEHPRAGCQQAGQHQPGWPGQ